VSPQCPVLLVQLEELRRRHHMQRVTPLHPTAMSLLPVMTMPNGVLHLKRQVSATNATVGTVHILFTALQTPRSRKGSTLGQRMKGLVGARVKQDKVGLFYCGDSRPAKKRKAPKARRLKAQELATVPTPTRTLPN
jgi:hypothetical protein